MDRSPVASFCSSFRSAPGPDLLFLTDAHRQTMEAIIAGIGGDRPVQVLTGDAGIGKTILAQQIGHGASAHRQVGQIGRTTAQLVDLRHQVPKAFGLPPQPAFDDPGTGAQAVAAACQSGTPALLIVDEAQGLPDAGLDYLAGLTDGPHPLPLLLVGPPGLAARLTSHPGLRSRIGEQFRLAAFSMPETAAYVAHRFRVAGCACHAGLQVFDDAAIAQLHAMSGGVPRVINHLVQSCLFEAGQTGRTTLDGAFVRACLSTLVEEGRLAHLLSSPPRRLAEKPPPVAGVASPARRADPPASRVQPTPMAATPVPAHRSTVARTGLAAAITAMMVLVPGGHRLAPSEGAISAAGLLPLVPVHRAASTQPPRPAPALPTRVMIQAPPDPERLLAEALTVGSADPQRAALLYTRAALWGNKRAAYYLGQIHESGDGVDQDLDRARGWYEAAGDLGGAASRLANLAAPSAPAPAPGTAPVPHRQTLFSTGQTELHWHAAGPAARFRVEVVRAGDNHVQRIETALSAILFPQPVARWRVMALGRDGATGPASAWSRLDPGPR